MELNLRKILVAIIPLSAAIALYLIFSEMYDRQPIPTGPSGQYASGVTDANTPEFEGQAGKIGDVGVDTLRKPIFVHRNEKKQIDRVFGFDELLHKIEDEWEIEKPYMNIYQRGFTCRVTADRGRVRVVTAADRPTPRDATFTGNVVVHIMPEPGSDIREGIIYLNDIVFLSDRSLLATSGPVKYVSQDAQMLGTGMELIHNDQLQRLEYFRIINLERLYIRSTRGDIFTRDRGDRKTSSKSQAPSLSAAETQEESKPEGEQTDQSRPGTYYSCVFSKDVLIKGPEQIVFAEQALAINDIFWANSSDAEPNRADPGTSGEIETDPAVVPEQPEPNAPPEQPLDIVLTCEGGVIVAPVDSPRLSKDSDNVGPGPSTTSSSPEELGDTQGRPVFVTRRIDYSAQVGDAVAGGPCRTKFYVEDTSGGKDKPEIVPVNLTAQKQTKYLSASNQIVMEGDCVCIMQKEDPNFLEEYVLSAEQITVDLPEDSNDKAHDSAGGIRHLAAHGGVVRLASVRKSKDTFRTEEDRQLGGIELQCRRFDYDPNQDLYTATGPGIVQLDNSKTPPAKTEPGKLSLQKQCYAFLRNFDTLRYFDQENRIVADSGTHGALRLDYIPIVKSEYGEHAIATATHVVALLQDTADGRTELSTLTASGGVTYEDEKNQFVGAEFFYDHQKTLMKVTGSKSQPCYFNGALVEGIEYDLKTDRVKARIIGPGPIQ